MLYENRVWNGVFDLPRLSLSPISSLLLYLSIVLFFLGISGCMIGDFVGAYFNTYYNAQKDFGVAEGEIWNAPDLKLQGAGKNYLAQFNVSQNAKTKFASVIEKCSKLLEYHPNSNLVDDALMMIGKSYFYQSDYQRAERKFKELISGYPESDLVFEARMLMAYSYYKEGDKTSARATAIDLLDAAKKEDDDNIVAYTSLLLGQQDIEDKNYGLALEHFRDAAKSAESKEQRAFALLNEAEMYNKTGDYARAEDAYAEATDQSPNYLGEYKGQIGVARMLAKQGKFEESLDLLTELRADQKVKEYFGEIELEMANNYRDEGNLSEAVEQYRYVDTAYARTEWAANSYYQLGLLYETRVGLYDSARVAYNKGRMEAGPALTVTPLLAKRADYMNRYAGFALEIRNMDSLRTFWLTPRDTAMVSADTVAQDTARGKKVAAADSGKAKLPPRPPLPLDSVLVRMASAKSELATLFYTTIGRTDSALFWYHKLIQDHPLSPLVPRALFSIAQIYSQDTTVARQGVDSLYRQLVEQYPQSLYAAEARRLLGLPAVTVSPDTAETLYHQAEQAILAGRNEHAIDTLRLIVEAYPSSVFAPRAEYAAGWLYEQVLDQPDSAIANYQRLRAKYPSSLYAARVQPKLIEVEMRNKAAAAAADSAAQKQNPVPEVTQKKAIADTVSPVRQPMQETGGGPDSTVVPTNRPPDTTDARRELPPISNQEEQKKE